jgi:intracellular multiplication protein IcmM
LGLLLFQAYLNQPDRDFYATNGETSPQALTSMDDPNYTSTPLLAEDVIRDSGARALPQ